MGTLLNTLGSPLGIKIAKGGPYPDAGNLDKQSAQAKPLADVGNSLLQQGSHLPGLGEMGVLQYLPQIFAALAAQTGAANPLASTNGYGLTGTGTGPNGENYATDDTGQRHMYKKVNGVDVETPISEQQAQSTPSNPFSLNPIQQSQLNQQQSQTSQDVKNAMARVRANLAARGLTNSSHANAAETYLRNEMLKRQNTNRASAGYNAYQSRLDTTNQFGSMLNNIFGQQQQRQNSLLGNAQSLISPQLQNTGAQANLAQQNSQNAGGPLGQLAGAYFGGMFNQPKQNPFVRPGQQGFDTGAGNAGGVGPTQPALSKIMWNFR